jgi:membrane protease YdiL (CAAX protease family)
LPLVGLIGVAATLVIDVLVAAGNGGVRPVAALSGLGDASNEWVLAAIFAVVAQPIAEGLVFYGVVQSRLRASLGPWIGYLLTAILFTVYHALVFGAQLTGGVTLWYGVVYPALVALFLGALRVRLGSTLAVIVAYVAMGITALLAALVVVG